MKITTFETVTTSENITNWKLWFNGMKRFSAVKVEPPETPRETEEEKPPDLGIQVSDEVNSADLFGQR